MLEDEIRQRLDSLTKPPGSLGRLEELALRVGLIQNTSMPSIVSKAMLIFCANHGVAEEGVSAYPAEVTRQMMANFHAGGAAINVLCRNFGIEPVIVDMGVDRPTRNFTREPAMAREVTRRAPTLSARARWASPTQPPRRRYSAHSRGLIRSTPRGGERGSTMRV